MSNRQVASHGAWKSPLSARVIASKSIQLGAVVVDGADIYWAESRPSEDGRTVIVRRTPDGEVQDVTPPGFSARTLVHEYGGGAFTAFEGVVYFSNFSDQRLYSQRPGHEARPVTADNKHRYADYVVDKPRNRVLCVREEHDETGHEPRNSVVAIDLDTGDERVLVSGDNFYAAPRLDQDGKRLAWLSWNHPNMPWDGTELWIADLEDDGTQGEPRRIAGGIDASVVQPQWAPDGSLLFVCDRALTGDGGRDSSAPGEGWWNLYRWDGGAITALTERAAEFARAQWTFGQTTYGFEDGGHVVCAYTQSGVWRLARLDLGTRELVDIETPFTSFNTVRLLRGRAVVTAGSPTSPTCLASIDLSGGGEPVILRRTSELTVSSDYLSAPEAIEFPTTSGKAAHAFFYPPKNPDFAAPEGERPPLVVFIHGGPTGATSSVLNLAVQYWTSRGIAVVDVNYGGSTGYGREYRDRLRGSWGVVDVDDCANAARYLVERGDVDRERLAIRGGSAGGYTALCALAFHDVFRAGASHFGVGDLEALAGDTHKFESRYLDFLIGPYPDTRDRYRERSPIHNVDALTCPVIFFQGLDDPVVPPSQSEELVAALRDKGVPVAYVPFEGEQHGFRKAENIIRALEGEFYFYGRIFGFEPADAIEPVAIDNL